MQNERRYRKVCYTVPCKFLLLVYHLCVCTYKLAGFLKDLNEDITYIVKVIDDDGLSNKVDKSLFVSRLPLQ